MEDFKREVNKIRNLGEQLSKAEFLEIQGLVKEIVKQKEVISDLVYERMDGRILKESGCKAVGEVEEAYENEQDEVYAIIGCAINCIHEIVSKYHEENCSQICLGWGKEFCNAHSCKYFGDLLEASRLDDVRAQHLWKVISIEYVDC